MNKKFKNNFSQYGDDQYYGIAKLPKDAKSFTMLVHKGNEYKTIVEMDDETISKVEKGSPLALYNANQPKTKISWDGKGMGGKLSCYNTSDDLVTCCKPGYNWIYWDQDYEPSGISNSFRCATEASDIEHYLDKPWPNHYRCLAKPNEKGERAVQLTVRDKLNDPNNNNPLFFEGSPDVCDLTTQSIQIFGKGGNHKDHTMDFPLCSLIKNHIAQSGRENQGDVTPGCADADNRLATNEGWGPWTPSHDDCVFKDNSCIPWGGDKCMCCQIHGVNLKPAIQGGLTVKAYHEPTSVGHGWGPEKNETCNSDDTHKRIQWWYTTPTGDSWTEQIPYNCDWMKGGEGGCATRISGASDGVGACALRFMLTSANEHACDDYNLSKQYAGLCQYVKCDRSTNPWDTKHCPGDPDQDGRELHDGPGHGFDIDYHCCCDLKGYENALYTHECAADYGADQVCCGQKPWAHDVEQKCPAEKPYCWGYVNNVTFGHCLGCARNYGEPGPCCGVTTFANSIDAGRMCPAEAPHCSGYKPHVHMGTCSRDP